MYGTSVPIESIDVAGVKVVNLEDDPFFNPNFRTNGYGISGYQTGWFQLQNGEKALLFLSDRRRVIYIPTTFGYSLVISADKAESIRERILEASS